MHKSDLDKAAIVGFVFLLLCIVFFLLRIVCVIGKTFFWNNMKVYLVYAYIIQDDGYIDREYTFVEKVFTEEKKAKSYQEAENKKNRLE